MSFILEALNRAEAQRRLASADPVAASGTFVVGADERGGSTWWMPVTGALVLALAGYYAYSEISRPLTLDLGGIETPAFQGKGQVDPALRAEHLARAQPPRPAVEVTLPAPTAPAPTSAAKTESPIEAPLAPLPKVEVEPTPVVKLTQQSAATPRIATVSGSMPAPVTTKAAAPVLAASQSVAPAIAPSPAANEPAVSPAASSVSSRIARRAAIMHRPAPEVSPAANATPALATVAPVPAPALPAVQTASTAGAQVPPLAPVAAGPIAAPVLQAVARPQVNVSGYAHAGDESARFAIINDRVVREGEVFAPGARLAVVDSQGVVIEFNGERYRP